MTLKTHIKILKENGEIEQQFEPHSFVRALIDILSSQLIGGAVTTATPDTANVTHSITGSGANFGIVAAAGSTATGIVAGTGTNPVDLANYALQTLIAEGNGAGQLNYQAVSFMNALTSGTTRKVTFSRQLKNNTASDITVNEIGLYATGHDGATIRNYCIDRTLSTFSIPAGSSRTIEYTISVTV